MPRSKVLVFQHVPFEPLGTLDPLLKDAGFRIRYVNFGREPEQRPELDRYEALIVLGGPMNADQINTYPNLLTHDFERHFADYLQTDVVVGTGLYPLVHLRGNVAVVGLSSARPSPPGANTTCR